MIYTYRKQLIAALVVIVIIIASVVTYNFLHSNNEATTKATATANTTVVKNADATATPLSDTTKQMVQTYVGAKLTAKHGKGVYTAIIRISSYKRLVTPDGGIITSFLVDIPETHETYLFARTGTDTTPTSASDLRCAPVSDQLNHTYHCQDVSND